MKIIALVGTTEVEVLVRRVCTRSQAELVVVAWDEFIDWAELPRGIVLDSSVDLVIVEASQEVNFHLVAVQAIERFNVDAVVLTSRKIDYIGSLTSMFLPQLTIGPRMEQELQAVLTKGSFISPKVRDCIKRQLKQLPDLQPTLAWYDNKVKQINEQRR